LQYIDKTHAIVALVRAGIGVAIVPESARASRFEEVGYRPLWTHNAYAKIDLAWSEEQTDPAAENMPRFAFPGSCSGRLPIASSAVTLALPR
jgi:DNA-binding transcriptional LysR family regulator